MPSDAAGRFAGGGGIKYAAVSETEVICDLRCSEKSTKERTCGLPLWRASETSPYATSLYFVGDGRSLGDACAGLQGALLLLVSIGSLEA
jgi:hypothetical protein